MASLSSFSSVLLLYFFCVADIGPTGCPRRHQSIDDLSGFMCFIYYRNLHQIARGILLVLGGVFSGFGFQEQLFFSEIQFSRVGDHFLDAHLGIAW